MSASHQQEIVQRMKELRSFGLQTAAQLPRDFDRATDWREHVRAHPIPAVLAAAAIGFLIVPARGRERIQYVPQPAARRSESHQAVADVQAARADAQQAADQATAATQKAGALAFATPLLAAVGSWVGRMAMSSATNALQHYAMEHLQSLPSSFTKHGPASPKRRSEAPGQHRAYTD